MQTAPSSTTSTPQLPAFAAAPGTLSVVVPVHGLRELTAACVASLRLATASRNERTELIVVDNASPDDTPAWLATQNDLRVVTHETNRGFAAACNAGLRVARGEFLAVLNNDTLAAPCLFDELLETLRATAYGGFVGPVSNLVSGRQDIELEPGEGPDDPAAVARRLQREAPGAVEEHEFLSGLCLLGHRSVWHEVGLFDERFGTGNFEDADLMLRARCAGYRLLIARGAYLHHLGSRTFEALGLDYDREIAAKHELFDAKWRDHPLHRVEEAFHAHDWQGVMRTVGPACCEPAQRVWALRCAARAREELGMIDEAIATWRTFLAARPLHAESTYRLAICLLIAGHEAAAREELAAADRRFVHSPGLVATVRVRVAQHLRASGRESEAWTELEQARAAKPDLPVLRHTEGAWLLEEGRYAEAETVLLPFAPDRNPDTLTNLGVAAFYQGRPREALERLDAAIAIAGPGCLAARHRAAIVESVASAQKTSLPAE